MPDLAARLRCYCTDNFRHSMQRHCAHIRPTIHSVELRLPPCSDSEHFANRGCERSAAKLSFAVLAGWDFEHEDAAFSGYVLHANGSAVSIDCLLGYRQSKTEAALA